MAPARVPGAGCRINALHNDVLLRAISFLDARQALHTCVLSRRWRDLWRSMPRINASRHEFDSIADTKEEGDVLFKMFVNRFLMLHNPTALDEFNLWYPVPDGDSIDWDTESEDANLWIGHALQCNARSVNVSIWDARLYLDSAVFTSKCFLTSLELSCVALFLGFFKSLQMGCTVLERLMLHDCAISDIEISSQTLKVFTIDVGCNFTFSERASISIPSLINLGYFPYQRMLPLPTNMASLETASVSVGTVHAPVDGICQFLRGLSDVTNLELCYEGETEMEKNFQWCPKFNNLTILTLGKWCLCADLYALIVFLQNSPNLLKLTLELRGSPDTYKKFIGELQERSCDQLKIVEIVCSEDWENDPVLNSLEKLLLENGITSGQINIIHWM
ncbi:LOW QUALITY PROTEIN: F-box/FBD/LRR-repeat protein At1g16930-like [Phragmites australis]|uniref:LOW QUALITY PROTEIN: F-box/FBD/LRR-repeat protein At1g16930-like n=1 Tax=Phragmites australis TaxID=29695 RepID=UPI002D7819A9|nr:LOW QUALITY PROTEIN: F-box/FBD/LRR-repeat protein At1g16930-like [Phragmites australis]